MSRSGLLSKQARSTLLTYFLLTYLLTPLAYLLTTTPAELGRRLGASVSVQGQASIGLTQNAMASQPYLVGSAAMPALFGRT